MPTWTVPATVIRVIDGDTIRLRLDLGWNIYLDANCRIAGINTPELNTQAGQDARQWAGEQLPAGAGVTYTSRQLDKYGRPLGALTYGGYAGQDYATKAIAAGHAKPYNGTGPKA